MIQTEQSRVRDHLETVLKRRAEQRALLLVEDDPTWVELAGSVLEKFDCVVDFANDAETALAMLRGSEWAYRAVFIDNGLPRMNGIQLLKIIKQERPQIMCIIITGFIDEKLVVDCKDCGVVLIQKPVRIEAIKPILAPLGINEKATPS